MLKILQYTFRIRDNIHHSVASSDVADHTEILEIHKPQAK